MVHREKWYTSQVSLLGKDLNHDFDRPGKKKVEVPISNRVCEYGDVKGPPVN